MARDPHSATPETEPCPNPHKRCYRTKKYAKSVIRKMDGQGNRGNLRVYKCVCGMFHIGHRRGSLYRRLKKEGALNDPA